MERGETLWRERERDRSTSDLANVSKHQKTLKKRRLWPLDSCFGGEFCGVCGLTQQNLLISSSKRGDVEFSLCDAGCVPQCSTPPCQFVLTNRFVSSTGERRPFRGPWRRSFGPPPCHTAAGPVPPPRQLGSKRGNEDHPSGHLIYIYIYITYIYIYTIIKCMIHDIT